MRVAWFALPFCSLFVALGYAKVRARIPGISEDLKGAPFGWSSLVGHLAAFATFLAVCPLVLPPGARDPRLVVLLYASAVVSIALAVLAFVPPRSSLVLMHGMGDVWIYASTASILTGGIVLGLVAYWNGVASNPLEVLTFRSVRACLGLFVRDVSFDPEAWRIATPNFRVRVRGGCSGGEGLALMLVFVTAWLWFFRREYRFPRALLLIPAALAGIWAANVARITALILIGHFGARDVALGGFHSQAGWILFNCLAVAFAAVAGRVPWFAREPERTSDEVATENPTAAYLAPFLAILAASLVSRAASAGFEWLYPLRFVLAALVLWSFRSAYSRLDWRFGGPAVGAGGLVFVLWIVVDSWSRAQAQGPLEAGLAALPPLGRYGWIAVRAVAAIVTVPMAEELAFRGYLPRRLTASDFESVSLRALGALPILASSLLFGLLHGSQWLAGTVAGVVYALVLRQKGRIGDAFAAHATTNALLAAWVITRGDWHLW